MPTYTEKLRDPRWQKKRLQIMQRDSFRCRECTNGTRNLQVHHCHYQRGDPWDADDSLLLTLCDECHEFRQEMEDAAKLALGIMFAKALAGEVEEIADELATKASSGHMPSAWKEELRWIEYAKEYPANRQFVEMVLGRVVNWPMEAQAAGA